MKILVLNGPNINMLGKREPQIYGNRTYSDLVRTIKNYCDEKDITVEFFQSNHEGQLIDKLHAARESADAVIINAGALTHYSYALRDAIAAVRLPCIEVHMSNVHAREEFRRHSVISPACKGVIAGFGKNSYILALESFKL